MLLNPPRNGRVLWLSRRLRRKNRNVTAAVPLRLFEKAVEPTLVTAKMHSSLLCFKLIVQFGFEVRDWGLCASFLWPSFFKTASFWWFHDGLKCCFSDTSECLAASINQPKLPSKMGDACSKGSISHLQFWMLPWWSDVIGMTLCDSKDTTEMAHTCL